METYTQEEMLKFLEQKINDGEYEIILARKIVDVKARQLTEPEEIQTILANGRLETPDGEKPQKDDWVVMNPGGEEYAMSDKTFNEKYISKGTTIQAKDNVSNKMETWGLYTPVGNENEFVQIDIDLMLEASWATQELLSGAFINITNVGDYYGIAEDEFYETYERV